MNTRIIKTYLFIFCFVYANLFSQNLPLNFYWSGKTDSALVLANKIIKNKSSCSKRELLNTYDFLAEYNLELSHFKNNLYYIKKHFELNKNTSLDSALFYARVANFTLSNGTHDTADFYCAKAMKVFRHVLKKNEESDKLARYYSYFGNAARNTKYRNSQFIDSAIFYSKNLYLKALHYRRYSTFLTDLFNVESKDVWQNIKLQEKYNKCINCVIAAEKFANTIYPDKKSYLHATIYKIWSLAERYRGNVYQSLVLIKQAKNALEDKEILLHAAEYSSICSWEASSNFNLYYKTHDLKFIYESEKTLLQSIPAWENFLEGEKHNGIKSFDDKYSINPYQKLVSVYFELYKAKKDIIYLKKCYSFIEFIKKNRTVKDHHYNFNDVNIENHLDTILNICNKKKCALVNYFIAIDPSTIFAIVSLPDTTLLIECSNKKNIDFGGKYYLSYSYNTLIYKNELKKSKKAGYSLYELYFLKIDSILKKRNISDVVIVPTELSYLLNFDLLQCDTILIKSILQSALINRYKFMYSASADLFINLNKTKKKYDRINLLVPIYNSNVYSPLPSSAKLINELSKNFIINKIEKDNLTLFFEKDKLIQFIGHVNANSLSVNQEIILSDNCKINSNAILKNDLTGSSYLINGCNSNLGKQEQYNITNSLPYQLLNQHASSVISSLWDLDDKENAEFLEKFYSFMAQGLASSDALYETKLYFAKENYSPSMWGAYVYYGSDFYLNKKNMLNNYWYLVIVLAGLIIFAVTMAYKKR